MINSAPPRPKRKKLFVGNVAKSVQQDEFTRYFEAYGQVADIILMKRKEEPEHRGFGFVTFENPQDADKVLAENHTLHDRTLNVNVAKGRTKKFFVGGLARDKTTTESMRAYFEQYAEIEDIFVLQDRGFGFVTLVEDGDNLTPIEQNTWHEIDGKKCEVKVARPREENMGPRGRGRGRGRGYGGRGRGGYGGGRGGGYGGRGGYGGGYDSGYGGGYDSGGYGGYSDRGSYGGGSYNQGGGYGGGSYGGGYQPY